MTQNVSFKNLSTDFVLYPRDFCHRQLLFVSLVALGYTTNPYRSLPNTGFSIPVLKGALLKCLYTYHSKIPRGTFMYQGKEYGFDVLPPLTRVLLWLCDPFDKVMHQIVILKYSDVK